MRHGRARIVACHHSPVRRTFVFVLVLLTVAARADVREILAERVAGKPGVGIVAGIIDANGKRVIAEGAANGDTLYEIGSVTKVFTALLLADAVQRGEVKLDDPVAKFLPATVKVPERNGKRITLHDLATHTSALPRLPSNLLPKDESNPYADYTVAQMYAFLNSYELPRDLGAQYEYSNLAMGLLGHALALRANTDYATLVRTRILEPLGMKDTMIDIPASAKARLARGHDAEYKPVANWDLPTLAGAGALRSTANDMLLFLSAVLGYTKTPLAPAMTSMLASRRATQMPSQEIALGWHIEKRGERELVWHNGGTGGYRSHIGFDAKTRTGVVVLTNVSTPAGVDDIGRHLLDPTAAPLTQQKAAKVDAKVLEKYVGRYALAPEFIITITRDGEQLFAQATGQPRFEIFAKSEREFFFKVVDARITFEDDALTLHQGGRDMRAPRVTGNAEPQPQRKEIAVDPAILDKYVGRYALAPTFIIAITKEGNSLFLQATAQPKFPIFAESERKFFLKVVDAQVTFEADETGRATGLVLHQNGMDQKAKRIE
jgi:CubicO group peptidase (beta-lactamase class C family)